MKETNNSFHRTCQGKLNQACVFRGKATLRNLSLKETKDLLTLFSWQVPCLPSMVAGGYVIPKLTRKRKELSSATVSESELIPSDIADSSAIPITVEIDGVSPRSVTLATIPAGNSGNDVMENIIVAISTNSTSTIHYIKSTDDRDEFWQHVQFLVAGSKGRLTFTFLKPVTAAECKLHVNNYDKGPLAIDCSGPGIEVAEAKS